MLSDPDKEIRSCNWPHMMCARCYQLSLLFSFQQADLISVHVSEAKFTVKSAQSLDFEIDALSVKNLTSAFER